MPQAVAEYVESKNIDNVEKIKRGIIKLYREDIAKYAEGYIAEATSIFNSIPSFLAHHDKKIKYSSLGEGDRFSSYKDAIHWVADSMVGNMCMGTDAPDVSGFVEATAAVFTANGGEADRLRMESSDGGGGRITQRCALRPTGRCLRQRSLAGARVEP